MDTVYGTKKYFQSLSGASDIYRSQACRAVSNDYTYQNTLGRRSTLGAYYHMNKQPSYTNDHSLNSQYSYNAWGIWRDGRNIAPSTFSTKTHTHYQKPRSFSIILSTAVFIVLLAVISIAGLAFYFSSIKANMEDPVLGFEGSFRIAKGDLYSTGLKYNHTTTYKQKIEFYKRFVERALSDNGLLPMRVDIWGFGEGPLIKVFFRTFLDVRKLPQNIHSVEEYIKESLFLETTAVKSLYRSLRIDPESVEIKRILDEQVVRSASLLKEAQSVPTSQTQLEKRLMKKPGSPPLLSKTPTTVRPRTTPRISHSVDDEPDVDVENAPVIQGSFEGSFEITKTDADISRKKVTPTKAYTSLPPKAVTPFSLRVKPKKPSIEKLTTIIPQQHPSSSSSTSTSSTTTSTTSSTTTTTTTTTTPPPPPPPSPATTTTTSTTTTTTTPVPTTRTTTSVPTSTAAATTYALIPHSTPATPGFLNHFSLPQMTTPAATLSVPKLDSNLFTSIPVLDTAPWKPIHREVPELIPGPPPAFPTKTLTVGNKPPAAMPPAPVYQQDVPQRRIDEIELPFIPENPMPPTPPPAFNPYAPGFFGTALRKPDLSEGATNPDDMMFYHSFGNPVFMPGTDDIERLGAGAHVQPHPLPVPLIDDVVVPPFRPLIPTMGSSDKLHLQVNAAGNEKFEHLGGGVIVKKHELSGETMVEPKVEKSTTTSTTTSTTSTAKPSLLNLDLVKQVIASTQKPKSEPNINRVESSANSELADTIGEFFMGLLNLPKEEVRNTTTTPEPIQSRIEPEGELSEEQQTVPGLEEVEEQEEVLESTTVKPNFMNLKELILQRNQASNESKKVESKVTFPTTTNVPTTSTTIPTTTTTVMPTIPTTVGSTTKRNRIRPTYNHNNKPPTILDDSSLFPSHSKWEFVNSSSTNNFGHTGNMRKVFNKTLQAWISEDVGNTEDNFTLNDIKTRINNATNIQDISLIFDTLASKLGITPVVPTKVPPFSPNKMKHKQRNETRTRPHNTPNFTTTIATTATTATLTSTTAKVKSTTTATPTRRSSSSTTAMPHTSPTIRRTTTTRTTTPPTASTPAPVPAPTTTIAPPPAPTTTHFVELPLQRREPFIKPMSSFMEDSSSEGIGAAIPVVGEAEVEVIDPNKYEEMLKSSQFAADTTTETTAPQLVTLMPVRSNSGIRTYPHRAASASASATAPALPPGSAAAVYEEEEMARGHGAATPGASSVAVAGSVGGGVSGGLGGKVASIARKQNASQGRRFPPAEAVVKGGIQVTVK